VHVEWLLNAFGSAISPRELEAVRLRYVERKTLRVVGLTVGGVSVERARQIVAPAMRRLLRMASREPAPELDLVPFLLRTMSDDELDRIAKRSRNWWIREQALAAKGR
jgi:hypothetical protein